MKVTICGPNLRDQSKGTFHVHAAGCGDLTRSATREPEYRNGWTVEAATREDVVRAIYSDHMAEQEGEIAFFKQNPEEAKRLGWTDEMIAKGVRWEDYDDLYIFDCAKQLDREEAV